MRNAPNGRLRFETLISDVSTRMLACQPEEADAEIAAALTQVRDHFGAGNCGLLRVQQDRRRAYVYQVAYAEGFAPVPPEVNIAELFPANYEKLVERGEVNWIPRTSDLPPSRDRESYQQLGITTVLDVPLQVSGGVRYILVMNTVGEERDWPLEYAPRLRVLGEAFVNALERKRAEALLRESEALQRLAAEAAGVGLWSLDDETGRFWVTETTRSLFGWAPDEEVSVEKLMALIHPEDVARVRDVLAAALQEGREEVVEYRVLLPERGERWVASRGRMAAAVPGARPRLSGLSVDVTERKRSEIALRDHSQRISAAAEVAHLGFYEERYDVPSLILGKRIRELVGIPPEEEDRAHEFWLDRLFPEDRERVLEVRRRLTEGEEGPATVEYRYEHPTAGLRWFRHSARVLERDAGGRSLRNLGVVHDVTDQKRAEEELRRTLEEVRSLRDEYQQQNLYLREQMKEEGGRGAIVGESEPILRMLGEARRVAHTDAGVLLTGETGTGKEILAEAIHEMSSRRGKPMVKVNCAALPATLIESELFGREKGAYTGALTQQVGRFELANGSTLFLDEIGELPLELQAKLLRVLQEGQFERLGGHRTHQVDVRVIAATNRDLPNQVKQGSFRADLFYRLNVFPIVVPPLRERQGDVALLVWHFVRHFAQKMGKTVDTIPRRTLEEFQRQRWPGNVRELRNLIERSVILTDTRTLHVEFPSVRAQEDTGTTLEEVERRHILSVLERTGWRVRGPQGAAALLGLIPTTLHSKMKKLGVARPRG